MKKKLVIFTFFIVLLIGSFCLSSGLSGSGNSQLTLELIKASAYESGETDLPNPDPPDPYRIIPPDGSISELSDYHY